MTFQHSTCVAAYGLSGVVAVAVTVAMLIPITPGPPSPMIGLDKIIHVILFFLIALPILSVRPADWIWLVPALAAFGGVIELIQPYVGRGREFWDFIANCVGLFLAIPMGRAIYRRLLKLRQSHQGERSQRQD